MRRLARWPEATGLSCTFFTLWFQTAAPLVTASLNSAAPPASYVTTRAAASGAGAATAWPPARASTAAIAAGTARTSLLDVTLASSWGKDPSGREHDEPSRLNGHCAHARTHPTRSPSATSHRGRCAVVRGPPRADLHRAHREGEAPAGGPPLHPPARGGCAAPPPPPRGPRARGAGGGGAAGGRPRRPPAVDQDLPRNPLESP